ncbi:MAG: dihydrofolate reductase family protein [Oscillospiraceae bacterium]|nr:dihydrofolate reductase family protein [Oscillospiraceae bacterium]
MNRPYVICHMTISVDGKVTGDFLNAERSKAGIEEYYRINREFKADAFACGRVTMEESFTGGYYPDLSKYADAKIDRTDYISAAEADAKRYAVSFDRHGKLGWKTPYIEDSDPGYGGSHVIQVMCEDVSDTYLAYLRDVGVSYIFAGETEMDLHIALNKLNELFGIESLLLEGGSIINGAFYNANLVDEISLVVLPVSALKGDRTLFNDNTGRKFKMKSSKVLKKGVAWIRYERG